MKMNGKKLSWFQFYFPGLLGTSSMPKQERNSFSIIGPENKYNEVQKRVIEMFKIKNMDYYYQVKYFV